MTEDYKRRQAELIASRVGEADAVITTALIPGRPAPRLITAGMVKTMRPGSVIIDMAAEDGGNCELTQPGKEIVTDNGVRIIGFTNLPATMPGSATQMFSKNIQTLIKHLVPAGELVLDFERRHHRRAPPSPMEARWSTKRRQRRWASNRHPRPEHRRTAARSAS